jgi:hypothetical protein
VNAAPSIPSRKVARIVVVIAAPFILPWAFFSTLVKEIGRAFHYAYLEVRIEAAELATTWRKGFTPTGKRHDDWY